MTAALDTTNESRMIKSRPVHFESKGIVGPQKIIVIEEIGCEVQNPVLDISGGVRLSAA